MTCSLTPTLHTLTPRIQAARWHFVRSPLAYAFMVAVMSATALTAQAAPSSKAVRSDPPKHTAGDIGQLPTEVQAALQRA